MLHEYREWSDFHGIGVSNYFIGKWNESDTLHNWILIFLLYGLFY